MQKYIILGEIIKRKKNFKVKGISKEAATKFMN